MTLIADLILLERDDDLIDDIFMLFDISAVQIIDGLLSLDSNEHLKYHKFIFQVTLQVRKNDEKGDF
jgi:hypothetical protein